MFLLRRARLGAVGEVRVAIRVRPGASRTQVGGAYGDALVVKVVERAADGKATEAALRALADALGLRRREVRLVSGPASRDKIAAVDGPEEEVRRRVARLREAV
jgi:uncharacterized protein YggU (UPF0235/DUF167 family)